MRWDDRSVVCWSKVRLDEAQRTERTLSCARRHRQSPEILEYGLHVREQSGVAKR